jgi:hypothetical protein
MNPEILEELEKKAPLIDIRMGSEENLDLAQLVHRSELFDKPVLAQKLFDSVKSVSTAPEFTWNLAHAAHEQHLHEPVVLGLDTTMGRVLRSHQVMFASDAFFDIYHRQNFDMNSPSSTQDFMEFITSSDRSIVFLVPNNIFSRYRKNKRDGSNSNNFTYHELMWLLEHPDKAKNVHLVFGAYEFIREKAVRELSNGVSEEDLTKIVGDSLTQWTKVVESTTS